VRESEQERERRDRKREGGRRVSEKKKDSTISQLGRAKTQ